MRYKLIYISECKEGMILGKDTNNRFGASIALAGARIDNYIIGKLQENEVNVVYIVDESSDEALFEKQKVLTQCYNQSVSSVKSVFKDLSKGKDLNIETLSSISNNLLNTSSNSGIGIVINKLKQLNEIDDYTFKHCINVALLSNLIGKWLNFNATKLKNLTYAALLHDIGKAKISPDVLNKKDVLTEEEFEEIKKHPIYSYRLIEKIDGLPKSILYGVLMHHEREDGSGYPTGAKSENIHEFAKIIAIADVYDAMTSERVYHESETPFKVLEMFQRDSFGILDSNILITFISHMASFYIGDKVILNSGEEGVISYINTTHISKPIINIGDNVVDLSKNKDLEIMAIMHT